MNQIKINQFSLGQIIVHSGKLVEKEQLWTELKLICGIGGRVDFLLLDVLFVEDLALSGLSICQSVLLKLRIIRAQHYLS